jgi:hypothetical protein
MTRWRTVATSILLVHVGLLAWIDYRNSPAKDEVGHLPAGIRIWRTGEFDLYHVNPPLVRAVAALPVLLCDPKTDWSCCSREPSSRPEWVVGQLFIQRNGGDQSCWFFCLARWACIPFCVLGGYFCCRWASELYGVCSGVIALVLWCFCPNVLAWGATICPDAAAAALGVSGHYAFWRWLKAPEWRKAIVAGLVLGIVQLTKMTWIILFAVWPVIWLLSNWPCVARDRLRQFAQLAAMLLLALGVLNVGYLFDGSLKMLGDYTFVSRMLAGPNSIADQGQGGNRFANTWAALLPVPLPETYVTGVDVQKLDFEVGKPSYLCGEWKSRGWWYYYLVCVALKVPIGTWFLGLLAFGISMSGWVKNERQTSNDGLDRWTSATWRDEVTLLLPAVVVFILVSAETGFSRYLRYILPCFPFAYIWISKVALCISRGQRKMVWLSGTLLAWSVTSSLGVYPHDLSYFNELAGGPMGGHRYLVDANIDWGQDLLYLRNWVNKHPEAKPLYMAHQYFLNPEMLGIETEWPPCGPHIGLQHNDVAIGKVGPQPGWYAMSVDQIHAPEYEYFLSFEPVATAGYSIYIYHITVHEANCVRQEMRLPML